MASKENDIIVVEDSMEESMAWWDDGTSTPPDTVFFYDGTQLTDSQENEKQQHKLELIAARKNAAAKENAETPVSKQKRNNDEILEVSGPRPTRPRLSASSTGPMPSLEGTPERTDPLRLHSDSGQKPRRSDPELSATD